MDFEKLLVRIRTGDFVESFELLPYLCMEYSEERCKINFRLAEAYSEIGDYHQAKIFINRSWIFSSFSPNILPLYIKIHSALDDIDSIKEAYKRLGMKAASNNNITEALENFNLWQYAYNKYHKLDRYRYDFDILESIENMAESLRFKQYQTESLLKRKIRLAYLIYGMTHLNSVLVKINCMLARYHDKDHFEIVFFVPESKSSIYKWKQARTNIKLLKKYNCKVIIGTNYFDDLERLLSVAKNIYRYKPDILIISALLAEFEHYFIASLHPAPIIVSLIQGPPPQFTAPLVDWSISWSKHPLIDSPCNCSLVHIGLDLPSRDSINSYSKHDIGIPDDSQILMSAGRYTKFQNLDFWKSIFEILSHFPNLYYVAAGVSKEQIPFLEELLTSDIDKRLRLMGWREDCLRLFCLADIFIDTFPSGGGHVLIDAMALGIPFVSFENNYMKMFDQTDWSVADEFVTIPELIAKRGDFDQFKSIILKLIDDIEYRNKIGKLCKEQIHTSMGCPEKGVRKFESTLLKIIESKMNQKKPYLEPVDISKYSTKSLNKFKRVYSKIKNLLIPIRAELK